MILTQAVNLSIAVALLIFFTRKTIISHFQSRHEDFHADVKKAEQAKDEAEKNKREISGSRIQNKRR